MATAPKLSLYNLFLGLAAAVSLAILGVMLAQMFSQAGTLGSHGTRLDSIDTNISRTEQALTKRFDELDAALRD